MAIEDALTSLLAGVASGRRYWGWAEKISASAGAYLVLNRISGVRDYTFGGASGYIASRFQVDAYGATLSDALAAANAATAALSGYSGTVSGTRIMGIFVEGPTAEAAAEAADGTRLHRQRIDAIIHHDE